VSEYVEFPAYAETSDGKFLSAQEGALYRNDHKRMYLQIDGKWFRLARDWTPMTRGPHARLLRRIPMSPSLRLVAKRGRAT
jgi:hypothetical protein